MKMHRSADFRLRPFSPEDASGLQLSGTVRREGRLLRADYLLQGPLAGLLIPSPAAAPSRRDELWRHTCFELFFAQPLEASYGEVNLSPSGDWNGYAFSGYRAEMAPLPVERLTTHLGPSTSDEYSIGFSLELTEDPGPKLALGVSAVLAHKDGGRSYFALHHSGERPDFHRRDGFRLRL